VALSHVTVIDGRGGQPLHDMTIVVRGRRIEAIVPASTPMSDRSITIVDMRGNFVTPGLIDAHVHLGTSERPAGIMRQILQASLLGGVTTVRDMGGQLEIVRGFAQSGAVDSVPRPRVVYAAFSRDRGAGSMETSATSWPAARRWASRQRCDAWTERPTWRA
jgi:N-acyl-D-aspartate/D-glutamate deacylase